MGINFIGVWSGSSWVPISLFEEKNENLYCHSSETDLVDLKYVYNTSPDNYYLFAITCQETLSLPRNVLSDIEEWNPHHLNCYLLAVNMFNPDDFNSLQSFEEKIKIKVEEHVEKE